MADLEGKTIAATYRSVLNVGTANNQELDTTPRVIADGAGNASALYLATDEVLINGSYQLTFNATGSGEYIYGDGTDLRVYSGADILLVPTGNVGIGTTTPTADGLSVTGAPGYDESGILQITTGTGAATDSKLVFGVVDTDYAYIQSIKPEDNRYDLALNPAGGNVGIGTASPTEALTIAHATLGGVLTLKREEGIITGGEPLGYIYFAGKENGNTGYGASIAGIANQAWTEGSNEGTKLVFSVTPDDVASPIVAMTIADDGKVGIGAESPSATLHLRKTATTAGTPLEVMRVGVYETTDIELAAGHGPSIDFYVPDGEESLSGGRLAVVKESASDTNNSSAMAFYTTADGSSAAERVRINSAGKVGIANEDPDELLHVGKEDVAAAVIKIHTVEAGAAAIQLWALTTRMWTIENDGTAGDEFRILNTSNDGIELPQGSMGGHDSSWVDVSDRTLKTNITPISDALIKLDKINGVNFRWKKFEPGSPNPNPNDISEDEWDAREPSNHVGVIAQEIYEVLPEAVYNNNEGRWGVYYTKIIPLLIEAVKELSAKVTALENA